MSIISKALEKAQEERNLKNTVVTPSVTSSPKIETVVTAAPQIKTSEKITKNTAKKPGSLLSVLIAVAVVTIFSTAAAIVLLHSPSKSPFTPVKPAETQATRVISHEDIPQSQPQTQSVVEKIRETIKNTNTNPIKSYFPSGDMPKLTGIMYTPSAPKAIMNDMVVSEGEKVGNYTVVEILPDKVKISSEDKEFELKLR